MKSRSRTRGGGRAAVLILSLGIVPVAGAAAGQNPVAPATTKTQEAPARDTWAGDARLAGQDVPVPSRKKYVAPEYPAQAAIEGIRGIVILEVLIGEDGKVSDARVTRSIPGLDEAALSAVRLWEYEPTKVANQPVRVLLSQSITFALRLPELQRALGVPELKSGGAPPVPASLATAEEASVAVTLGSQGEVTEAAVLTGSSVLSNALLRAVKSWRFVVAEGATPLSFVIEAAWNPSARPSLTLKATNPKTETAQAGAPAPGPGAASPAPVVAPEQPGESRASATPSPSAPAEPTPAGGSISATGAPETTPPPPPDAAADVATEVLPARPEPPVMEEGVSGVTDVVLGENIPDLVKGRRPVWPPLARLGNVTGEVVVRFSVDLAGRVTVHSTEGVELLREAAEQGVGTWLFRRTAIDRLNLIATFTFGSDRTMARVVRVP